MAQRSFERGVKMKNKKHTPGPWNVRFCAQGTYKLVNKKPKSLDQEIENCALISAAPEMLEALATIYNFANLQPLLETKYSKALVSDLMKQMQNAIAKAKGE